MLNDLQRKQLLAPLNSTRVSTRDNLSYLEAWDVRRTLIRLFGFGGWSAEVLSSDLVFEELAATANSKGKHNWDVAYKVTLRLTIHDIDGEPGNRGSRDAVYTESAIGTSHQPDRGEAHDMAVKTAESDALKRCAVNLGTQFGLSLYQKSGNRKPTLTDVVQRTLDVTESVHGVPTGLAKAAAAPLEPAVTYDDPPVTPEMPSESGEETPEAENPAPDAPAEPETPPAAPEPPVDDPRAVEFIEKLAALVKDGDVPGIITVKKEIATAKAGRLLYHGKTLSKWVDEAVIKAGRS